MGGDFVHVSVCVWVWVLGAEGGGWRRDCGLGFGGGWIGVGGKGGTGMGGIGGVRMGGGEWGGEELGGWGLGGRRAAG